MRISWVSPARRVDVSRRSTARFQRWCHQRRTRARYWRSCPLSDRQRSAIDAAWVSQQFSPLPMRIAVISDTHNRVPPQLPELLAEADEIWHLGDVCDE